eukprot:CAMPEP_0184337574 /NCGR_PEP_ID=MMETSP1089-20130417/5975_1 /TAXON_ID=38269 ORGANISM="Gloeochaete wittrockiana, Strain SAG46.84" /NCGR_SAMPLE_ID=MMETSP1089 /ASSEMBLY_ACC=CAM_ASM_000445 /LENGTH=195 /DNA_ID=CAMNT_0026663405 /DNA_START=1 /DNA_END=584 /DNA_ORIENTATION=+
MALALFLVALAATVTAQTQVLTNPEFIGCTPGISTGGTASPWTDIFGTYSFSFYSNLFTNEPVGDVCFAVLFPGFGYSEATQTNIVLNTGYRYDFETLASCYNTAGGTCAFSLTINGNNVPLSTNVITATGSPTTLVSITATNIPITSSPATLTLSATSSILDTQVYFAHATLTDVNPDTDSDGIPNFLDNCPTV